MNKLVTVTKISIGTLILLSSCVPTKKFKASEAALQSARNDSATLARKVSDLQADIAQLKQQVADHLKTIDSKVPKKHTNSYVTIKFISLVNKQIIH